MHIRLSVRAGVMLASLFGAGTAWAQDAGMMAAQQAQQTMAEAATLQQMQQQSAQLPAAIASGPASALKPQFSLKAGRYGAPVTIRMKTRSRSAVIYYTTDGWTPTTASLRYEGPVEIRQTTQLQAITVSPGFTRSAIAEAVYTLPSRPDVDTVVETPAVAAEPSRAMVHLPEGTTVPLLFASAVSSRTAKIGDRVPLLLARDLRIEGVLVAAKGTRAWGNVILADRAMRFGQPGVVQFTVDRLELAGSAIPLRATEELDGVSHETKAGLIGFIPLGDQFVRGRDAEIPAGARVTAYVAKESTVDTAQLQ